MCECHPKAGHPTTVGGRCDSCGAAAYTLYRYAEALASILTLCAHHATEQHQALTDQGWALVEDRRAQLLPQPVSAQA